MIRTLLLLAFPWLMMGIASPLRAMAQEEPKSPISKTKLGDYVVELIDNSPTVSQALAINRSGAVVGLRERANAEQTIYSQIFFYCDDKRSVDLPLLEGFTNVEGMAISDNGLVAGLASRPIGTPGGSLTAIVWDSKTGKITNLGFPDGYAASHAQDINAAGTQISGYVSGAEPARMQPCVWTWDANQESWHADVLPTRHDYNPYILSSRVIISPDGQQIAACCTARFVNSIVESSLFIWKREGEKWQPDRLSDKAFLLRDMNNQGLIVGCTVQNGLKFPCFVAKDSKLTTIDLLPGDESGEAWSVNAEGTIVGFSDDPRGPEGGPQAFVWQDGKTRAVDLGDVPYSAAYGINEVGQIAGLLDTLINADEATPIEKTLAFRTLPTKAAKP